MQRKLYYNVLILEELRWHISYLTNALAAALAQALVPSRLFPRAPTSTLLTPTYASTAALAKTFVPPAQSNPNNN